MKKSIIILFVSFALNFSLIAQLTVGTTLTTNNVSNGYTLFSPNFSFNTYLIDNCGRVVNEWSANFRPGLSVYLLEDGTLMRTGRGGNGFFTAGGVGGVIEHYDWDNNLLWTYEHSSSTFVQHHDIEVLPNGNVLLISFEKKNAFESIDAGRNPSLLNDNELWPEMVLEIQPLGIDSGVIVWEWHMWDHLIQDYDNTKSNYGVVKDHPELFDINYTPNGNDDWAHVNSIDYNPERDEIILSSRSFNEFWIIDHSTSSIESASHSGGNRGKGGDILYRWGNNNTFKGNVSDALLDGQHDVEWIPQGLKDAGSIMVFDNGNLRGYSSIKIINPLIDLSNNYILQSDTTYGPNVADWEYIAPNPTDFYSGTLSGANRLQNGNIMMCEGTSGKFTEIDTLKNIVWQYINPMTNSGITSQGDPILGVNTVFRSIKYDASYSGFDGKDLTPGLPIESNPDLSSCLSTNIQAENVDPFNLIYPNPFIGKVVLDERIIGKEIIIYDVYGRIIYSSLITNKQIDLSYFDKGVYWIKVENNIQKVLKK
jgi:arylsulfotransferase ASST/type IX secretion system substrate protein